MRAFTKNQVADSGAAMSDEQIEAIMAQAAPEPGASFWHTVQFAPSDDERKTIDAIAEALRPLSPDRRHRAVEALVAGGVPLALDKARRATFEAHGTWPTEEFTEMAKDPRLQKLGESAFHKCTEAWRDGSIQIPTHGGIARELQVETAENWYEGAQVFVVQHDLASAFKNSAEFGGGEWRLPYPRTIFEFRISGRRCALALIMTPDKDGEVREDYRPSMGIFNVETKSSGWALGGMVKFDEAGTATLRPMDMVKEFVILKPVIDLAIAQARAICICLEAEVAETEIVRAPHKLNAKRERAGKLPLYDYHVVDLSHRKRYAARLPDPGDQVDVEKTRKRLHWVRAHWRHYPNHKVFLRWHLRGDPDLGFVDKEYRL